MIVISQCQECIDWLLLPLLGVRGSLLLLSQLSSSHSINMVAHTALEAWQSHLVPPSSLHGEEGFSFPGLVPPNDMVNSESVVAVKPGDSGVVIGNQIDEFTCTQSIEWFVAHSYIYPGFTGKVWSLYHYPLEPGCEDYSFLDHLVSTASDNSKLPFAPSIRSHKLCCQTGNFF